MLAILALACVLRQEPSKAADVNALYDALIKRTNELESFLAVYKATTSSDDKVDSIRIAYRAPDELRFEGKGHQIIARNGVITTRTTAPDGKESWARVAWEESSEERCASLSKSIAVEFERQRTSWSCGLDCGQRFELEIGKTDGGRHDRFGLQLGYACPREALLGWLQDFKWVEESKRSLEVVAEGDDRRVMKTPNGSAVTLSMRTGFLESMVRKDDRGTATIELETLDLHPKFDDDTFDPGAKPEGVEDISAALTNHVGEQQTVALEDTFAEWISSQVGSKSLEWNDDSRTHAEKVFETIAGDAITSRTQTWQSKTKQWIEHVGEWIRSAYAPGGGKQPELEAAIEARIEEGRRNLVESLNGYEKKGPSSPFFTAGSVPDADLRTDLDGLLLKAWAKAFERVLHDPMLEAFDEAVSKAKAGG